MGTTKDGEVDPIKKFEEESDAFFEELIGESSGGAGSAASGGTAASTTSVPKGDAAAPQAAAAPAAKTAEASDIESEYAILAQSKTMLSQSRNVGKPAVPKVVSPVKNDESIEKFDLDEEDDGHYEQYVDHGPDGDSAPRKSSTTGDSEESDPEGIEFEAPPAPDNFSQEDLDLHQELMKFYKKWQPSKLPNVNGIVAKYRGRNVPHLWAQLALKYGLGPWEGVEHLARTLYPGAPFEYADLDQSALIAELLAELQHSPYCLFDGGGGSSSSASGPHGDATQLLDKALQRCADDGTDTLIRFLCFRGVPDDRRPVMWKVLLHQLPMARHAEWAAVEAERRALYASYRAELLCCGEDFLVEVRPSTGRTADLLECQDLLHEIRNDVDRTRRDHDLFQQPATRVSLLCLLFIYARLNPGIRYVQGMNEVAAVLLWVMSSSTDKSSTEHAEADAFWVFSGLMTEIKESFMEALDHTGEGVHALGFEVMRLLRSYDPILARHLQVCELPHLPFIFRWCALLFAQDLKLHEAARLWDCFFGDPGRFKLVSYLCVGVMMWCREELLLTDKQFALAEVLQGAPRSNALTTKLLRRAWAICAFERRAMKPDFPPRAPALTEWAETAAVTAQEAAAKAQELSAEMAKTLQESIAPAVSERASQVSAAAADKAQAVQLWFEETGPARREALEQAQTRLSSVWDSVRSNTQRLAAEAAEYSQSDEVKQAASQAASTIGSAADSAVTTASTLLPTAATTLLQKAAAVAAVATAFTPRDGPTDEDQQQMGQEQISPSTSASGGVGPDSTDDASEEGPLLFEPPPRLVPPPA